MNFEVIKQQKSWLAVNPVIGCPSECKYCYRHDDNIFSVEEPIQIENEEETLNNLLNHRFFLLNSTPIAMHNMTTDPFFELPKKVTYRLLEGLDNLGYKNTVGLITKQLVTKDDISFLESLSNIDVNVLVTYSEMPESIEPIGNEKRIQSLKNLSNSSTKTILYWRPIINGQNTDEGKIRKVLEVGESCADAFVVSGLKASPKITAYLESRGIQVEGNLNPNHKYILGSDLEKILESYNKKEISTPLFRRTSCAISYLKCTSDYNAHWNTPKKNCLESCPKIQKQRCDYALQPEKGKVEFLLGRLGYNNEFEIHEKYLEIKDKLTKEEITFLRHNLLFPVDLA